MIIAVDGPTASGKGTIAKALAEHFALPVLDTGLLYRAVGYQTQLNHGDADKAADALAACDFPASLLDDPALRYETTGGLASRVSVHPQVRAALFQRQLDFANQPGGAVLDGRDIGTVIAPHADAKLFVTASAEEPPPRRAGVARRRGRLRRRARRHPRPRRARHRPRRRAAAACPRCGLARYRRFDYRRRRPTGDCAG